MHALRRSDAARQSPFSARPSLAHHASLPSAGFPPEICTGSATLSSLAVRGEDALWTLCAQLHGHLEPRSLVGKRYCSRRDLAKHPADRWAHGARLQPAHETIFNPVAVVEAAIEKGASSIMMPISSRRQLNELPDDLAAKITIHYYLDARDALLKALAI